MSDAPTATKLPEPPTRHSLRAAIGSARFVRLFQPQFAQQIEAGHKRQTVRPTPKRMPKPGDAISLRQWTGKPYRSKQRIIREATITGVESFHLDLFDQMIVGGSRLPRLQQDWFAQADGFASADHMRRWFGSTHGLPFDGIVIYWQNNDYANSR